MNYFMRSAKIGNTAARLLDLIGHNLAFGRHTLQIIPRGTMPPVRAQMAGSQRCGDLSCVLERILSAG
jgi:hypothetical protein